MKVSSYFKNFFKGLLALIVIVFCYGLFSALNGFEAVSNFMGFVIISIICTGGIALVIWIPVFLVLGLLVTKIIGLFFRKGKQPPLGNESSASSEKISSGSSSNNELAIIDYIVGCRNTGGASDDIIRSNLKGAGWNDFEVSNAFKKCAPGT